jgi:thiol-disulfide isomerase/thioredoxin
MQKSLIVALGTFLGLAGLAIGIAATRPGDVMLGRPLAPRNARGSGSESAGASVIRLASNPQLVPPFLLTDLNGMPVSTADWKGKVVILTFWATWCPPCREEIPMLIGLQNRYKDRLQVVGISVDDADPSDVKKFAQDEGINYPIVMATREVLAEYGGAPGLPTTFVIDTQSRVVQKHVGLYPESVYEQEIRYLLGLPVEATVETFQDVGQIFLKNATLATSLPGVDFAGLTPEQKKIALRRLNTETCDCGCNLTLAQCRLNDTSCPISKKLAAQVVKEIREGKAAPPTPSDSSPHVSPDNPPSQPPSSPPAISSQRPSSGPVSQ